MIDPTIIFGGIKALHDIIDSVLAIRRDFHYYPRQGLTEPSPEGAEKERKNREKLELEAIAKHPEASSTAVALFITGIHEELLKVMLSNIAKAKERLVAALEDPANSNQAKDHELDVARSNICSELKRLRRFGFLGPELSDLNSLWDSFGCK